jgi:predicted permease
VDTLWQDVRHAARLLARSPAFAATAVATIALAVGANTAIFSVVDAVLLRPLAFGEPDRLVRIWEANPSMNLPFFSASEPNWRDWREQSHSLARLAAFRRMRRNVTGTGEPETVDGAAVSADFFETLAVRPLLGRGFMGGDDAAGAPPVALVGHGLWRRRFGGDPQAVGREVTIDGRPHTIVGVLPASLDFRGIELWTPLVPNAESGNRRHHVLGVVGRLAAGATVETARADLQAVAARLAASYPDSNRDWTVRIERVEDWLIESPVRRALVLLLGAVGFVLLIACANLASLQLARAAGRQRELAVRAALGAGRGRLARQLLTECLLLGLLGGTLGLAVAFWGVEGLRRFGPDDLPRLATVALDARVLAFNLAASLVTGLLFGLAPALQASRTVLRGLREDSRTVTAAGRARLRGALVVGEVALSLALLVGAGLLVRSFLQLQRVPLGFRAGGVLTAQINPAATRYPDAARRTALFDEIVRRVVALPGVEAAGLTNIVPFGGGNSGIDVTPEEGADRLPGGRLAADWRAVSPGFFAALGVPRVRGRTFTDADGARRVAGAEPACVVVVSAGLAEALWPGLDPLGRRFRTGGAAGGWCTAVGVVGDVRNLELETEPRPAFYFPAPLYPQASMSLLVRSSVDRGSLVTAVRREVAAVDADLPLSSIRGMEEIVSATASQPRFSALLLGLLSAASLVLAAVGLYGLLSNWVGERTREFGVRLAVGARPSDVLALVLRQGMLLGLAGLVLGLVAAAGLTRLLGGLLFGVGQTDLVTYAGVCVLLAGTVAVACYLPARRASLMDPVAALRFE